MRTRTSTKAAPTQTPRTTQRLRPKMEVGSERWSFMCSVLVSEDICGACVAYQCESLKAASGAKATSFNERE